MKKKLLVKITLIVLDIVIIGIVGVLCFYNFNSHQKPLITKCAVNGRFSNNNCVCPKCYNLTGNSKDGFQCSPNPIDNIGWWVENCKDN